MGAYIREALYVVEMGTCIHRVLILYGCLLSRFYGISTYMYMVLTKFHHVIRDKSDVEKSKIQLVHIQHVCKMATFRS